MYPCLANGDPNGRFFLIQSICMPVYVYCKRIEDTWDHKKHKKEHDFTVQKKLPIKKSDSL